MNWHNLPYWLRGGVIGGGVTLIFVVWFYSCAWLATGDGWECLIPLDVSPMYPIEVLFGNKFFSGDLPFVLLPIFSVAIWFIAGALIGFLVSFVKAK